MPRKKNKPSKSTNSRKTSGFAEKSEEKAISIESDNSDRGDTEQKAVEN